MAGLRNPPFVAPVAIQELKDDFEKLFTATIDMEKERYRHGYSTEQKPVEVPDATFSDDPVALSVTSYLIWLKNPSRRWTDLAEVGRPTAEARMLAHDLRTYYTQRYTMLALMGHEMTEFQHKMIKFLMAERPLKVDEKGILYRLPYFWQEDMALDKIFEGATDLKDDSPPIFAMTSWTTLTPVREVLRSRKSGDHIQFWFQNPEGERCVYDVKSDNKLLSVFRSLFKRPELAISCHARMEQLRGSQIKTRFWRLSNLELQ